MLYDGDELLGVEYLSTADVLDPSTLTFSPTFGGMSVARSGWDAALLPNGKILVPYGGVLPDGTALSPSSDVYDPANDTFAAGPSPTFDRTHEPSVTLPDGRVVFVGGRDVAIDARTNTIDIYDPSQNTFTTSTATMSIARWMHQATALRDGSVLITGGLGMNNIPLIGGELFVPSPSVVDRLFSDGFEVSRLAEAGSAAAAASPITLSTACAEAHRPAPDQARRGIVEVWQLADGTECEWP